MLSGSNGEPPAPHTIPWRTPHNASLRITPHIRVACRDPDPDAAWDRNHRRPRNVAAIKSAHADALMLTRAPPGRSTTIAGAN